MDDQNEIKIPEDSMYVMKRLVASNTQHGDISRIKMAYYKIYFIDEATNRLWWVGDSPEQQQYRPPVVRDPALKKEIDAETKNVQDQLEQRRQQRLKEIDEELANEQKTTQTCFE